MLTLSSYMSDAANRKLSDAVIEQTKVLILDTIAAMLSGSELPPGRFAIQFARAYPGERMATVVGSNLLCGPMEAALVNGMLAQFGETDDTHPPSYSHLDARLCLQHWSQANGFQSTATGLYVLWRSVYWSRRRTVGI